MENRPTGTCQADRLINANQDVSIIDGSEIDFLNYIQDFSTLIHYWNDQGDTEGNWLSFFKSDISFILADISRFQLKKFQQNYQQILELFGAEHQQTKQQKHLISLYQILLETGKILGQWYQNLTENKSIDSDFNNAFLEITEANLSKDITSLIEIFNHLSNILDQSPNSIAESNISYETTLVSSLLKPLLSKHSVNTSYPGNGQPLLISSFKECFEQIIRSIFTSISQIIRLVPSFFKRTLEKPTHSPQISLILAFYKMLEPAKNKLNELSAEHQKLYFNRILQQRPQPFVADKTFLTFTPTPSSPESPVFIPAHTTFTAGTSPSGTEIIYATEHDIAVNQIRPVAFKTIYNGTNSEDIKTAVKGSFLSSPIANSSDGYGAKLTPDSPSWPTFGQRENTEEINQADIGFAISSPELFFSDGNRRIRFNVLSPLQDISNLSNSLQKLGPIIPDATTKNKKNITKHHKYLNTISSLLSHINQTNNEESTTDSSDIANTILEIENTFQKELQQCVSSIAKVVARNPIPLEEWLESATELSNLTSSHLILTKYHQNQVSNNLETTQKSNPEIPSIKSEQTSQKNKAKQKWEHSLTGLINQKNNLIKGLFNSTSQKLELLSTIFDKQSGGLAEITNKILSNKKNKPLAHVSKLTKQIKSIHNDIDKNTEVNKTIILPSKGSPTPNNNTSKKITSHLDSTLTNLKQSTTSLVSLQWLIKLKAIIEDAEQRLIKSSNNSFLVKPTSNINDLFTLIEKQNKIISSPELSSTTQQNELQRSISKIHSDTEDLTDNTPDLHHIRLATQGVDHLVTKLHSIIPQISNHVQELTEESQKIKTHLVSDHVGELITLFTKKHEGAKKQELPKLNLLIDNLKDLKNKIHVTSSNILSKATDTQNTAIEVNKHLQDHKSNFLASSKKSESFSNNQKNNKQQLLNIHQQLLQSNKSAHPSGSTLMQSVENLKQRLDCWSHKYELPPGTEKSQLQDINTQFVPIINLLNSLLTEANSAATNAQKQKIQHLIKHIQGLQQRVNKVDSHFTPIDSRPLEKETKNTKKPPLSLDPDLVTQLARLEKQLNEWEKDFVSDSTVQSLGYIQLNSQFQNILTSLQDLTLLLKEESDSQQLVQIESLTENINQLQQRLEHSNRQVTRPRKKEDSESVINDLREIVNTSVAPLVSKIKGDNLNPLQDTFLLKKLKSLESNLANWSNGEYTSDLPKEPNWQAIDTLLNKALNINYSTTKGWAQVSNNEISSLFILPEANSASKAPTQAGFQIDILLDKNAPTPAAWTSKACGGDYISGQPTFRSKLNQTVELNLAHQPKQTISSYPLFAPLNFQEIVIWGDVSDSSNYTAQNQLAALKTNKPFPPFGEQPIQGAEFYFGNCESLCKKLDYFMAYISWYNLPKSKTGFAEMYQSYNRFGAPGTCYTNEAFEWSIDILSQGIWSQTQSTLLQPFDSASPSTTSNPIFEWSPLPQSSAQQYSSSVSFTQVLPEVQVTPLPQISKPSLPPLPVMSSINVGGLSNNTLVILEPQQVRSAVVNTPSAFSATKLFDEKSTNGFLRFTLQNPQEAFGSKQYPNILAAVTNANLIRSIDLINYKALSADDKTALLKIWDQQTNAKATTDTASINTVAPKKNKSPLYSVISGLLKEGLSVAETTALATGNPALIAVSHLVKNVAKPKKDTEDPVSNPEEILTPLKLPPPPWIPTIKGITSSYGSNEVINVNSLENSNSTFFHIHPFGIDQPLNSGNEENLNSSIFPQYDQEGYLYIGLEQVIPPQVVNLLFQLDEASGDKREDAPDPSWFFLGSSGWQTIPSTQVRDETSNFIKSGIISLSLLSSAVTKSTLFLDSPPLYWIKVVIPSGASATCRTLAVTSQATSVIYKCGAEVSTHFNSPLPADSIKKSITPIKGITKISQPIESFSGISPESDIQFHARVSERLRHKDRAVTAWDFEHLLLQRFSMIRACLTLNSISIETGYAPGTMTLLVFPEISSQYNPLNPLLDRSKLEEINNFLISRCNPFVKLSVTNPDYLFTLVSAHITLAEGYDPGHSLQVLNSNLIDKVTPWAKSSSALNPFCFTFTYDNILQFILAQPYVQSVNQLQLSLVDNENSTTGGSSQPSGSQPILPPNQWTLLSSVNQHNLSLSELDSISQKESKELKKIGLETITPDPFVTMGNTLFLGEHIK